MKKIILILIIIFSLFACSNSNNNSNDKSSPVEDNSQQENLFDKAINTGDVFIIDGIEAKVIKATTSLIFIGNNFNENMMGVRIYIDYDPGFELSSSSFVILDDKYQEYTEVKADGLDYLGKNRGEADTEYGYIRVSLPRDSKEFLLSYVENDIRHYIRFSVVEE